MKREEIELNINRSKQIHGWFAKEAALLIGALDEFQKDNHITGDIFEIGVHHGKSTILFNSLLDNSEQLKVCDIFGSQENNISGSGKGDKEIFIDNIKKHSFNPPPKIYTCLSSDLNKNSVGSGYRMFHVDGGHNCDEALSDLLLASSCIRAEGLIILDDPFRPEWPGVTEALIKFLSKNQDFQALVVGFNKIIISKTEVSTKYLSFLDDPTMHKEYKLSHPYSFKKLPFLRKELRIFYLPSYINQQKTTNLFLSILKRSGIYRLLKQ